MSIEIYSKDDVVIACQYEAIRGSKLLDSMLGDLNIQPSMAFSVPMPEVGSATLKKVVEWCEHHYGKDADKSAEAVEGARDDAWSQHHVDVPRQELFELLEAADYMDVPDLLNTGSKFLAGQLKDMSDEEMLTVFGILKDPAGQEPGAGDVPAVAAGDDELPVAADAIGGLEA